MSVPSGDVMTGIGEESNSARLGFDHEPGRAREQPGAPIAVDFVAGIDMHRAEHVSPLIVDPNAGGCIHLIVGEQTCLWDLAPVQEDDGLNGGDPPAGDCVVVKPPQPPRTSQDCSISEAPNRQPILLWI